MVLESPKNRRGDTPSYGDAMAHPKIHFNFNLQRTFQLPIHNTAKQGPLGQPCVLMFDRIIAEFYEMMERPTDGQTLLWRCEDAMLWPFYGLP